MLFKLTLSGAIYVATTYFILKLYRPPGLTRKSRRIIILRDLNNSLKKEMTWLCSSQLSRMTAGHCHQEASRSVRSKSHELLTWAKAHMGAVWPSYLLFQNTEVVHAHTGWFNTDFHNSNDMLYDHREVKNENTHWSGNLYFEIHSLHV